MPLQQTVTAGASEATLRLFVAIELPGDVRQALGRTMDALKDAGAGPALRWVRPDGIHITLKFLGATDAGRVPPIGDALRTACARTGAIELRPEGLGSFGGRRNLRVIWVGVAADTVRLAVLAKRIDDALTPLGYEPERRPFAAHLTLARVREDASADERERLHNLIGAAARPVFPLMRASAVSLMQSTLGRGGAVYHPIERYPLD